MNLFAGHKFLWEKQGILHRDISAGNVLLASEQSPEPGHEGFVMDIEFAHHQHSEIQTEVTTVIPVASIRGRGGVMTEPTERTHKRFDTVSVKRGAAMTVSFIYVTLLYPSHAAPSGHGAIHGRRHFGGYGV